MKTHSPFWHCWTETKKKSKTLTNSENLSWRFDLRPTEHRGQFFHRELCKTVAIVRPIWRTWRINRSPVRLRTFILIERLLPETVARSREDVRASQLKNDDRRSGTICVIFASDVPPQKYFFNKGKMSAFISRWNVSVFQRVAEI